MYKFCRFFVFAAIFSVALFSCEEVPDDKELVSIEITKEPEKKEYFVFEDLDPTGMEVIATYSDNSIEQVEITPQILSYDFYTPGTNKTVTVVYKGKEDTIDGFIVTQPPRLLVSIAITSQPNKKTYFEGESFDFSGLVLTGTYSDGTTETPMRLFAFMMVYNFSEAGTDKTVTVEYAEGVSATITGITVLVPELLSIEVSGLTQRNYGMGEPLNSAEKQWTILARYQGVKTETIENDDPELVWDKDFSATAGNNKTVAVTYKGVTGNISGINVQTLSARIRAALTRTATITLYVDEILEPGSVNQGQDNRITSGSDITLKSSSAEERIISRTTGGVFFSVIAGKLTLDENVTIDGCGIEGFGRALVEARADGVFVMKAGATIKGGNSSGTFADAGAVSIMSGGIFNMEGGQITGNKTTLSGGGVAISGSASTFTMSGGTISGNEASNGGGVCIDNQGVLNLTGGAIIDNKAANHGGNDICASHFLTASRLNLSGAAQVGDVTLGRAESVINLPSSFTGSIKTLNLYYNVADEISDVKIYWADKPLIVPATGVTVDAGKFTLGKFYSFNASEDIEDSYRLDLTGRLVAK